MYLRTQTPLGEAPPAVADSFPNIRAKMPALYPAALNAEAAVTKLDWFKSVYLPLAAATANAHLALDASDEVVVVPEQASTEQLLGPKLLQAVLKQSGKSLVKALVGADFARTLGLLDLFLKVATALSLDDRRRLVSEQNRSRSDEAYRHKLRFFIRLRIAQMAPQADAARLAPRMERAFFDYRSALGELWRYQDIELNLRQGMRPNQRRPPTMRSRD